MTRQTNLFGYTEYGCISADPPWAEEGGGGRGAQNHYPLIKTKEQIFEVMTAADVWCPAETCHLWLWVTNNFLDDGMWLLKQLGFRYITNRPWVKMEEVVVRWEHPLKGETLYKRQHHGLGQYMWTDHEMLLLGVRGQAVLPGPSLRPRSALLAPKGEHSEKPEQAYIDMTIISPEPRLEMFARRPRQGWDVWGLEADGSRIRATGEDKCGGSSC